jgi:hypothetical protein
MNQILVATNTQNVQPQTKWRLHTITYKGLRDE